MKTLADGVLVLPRWTFTGSCPRVPHRRRDLVSHTEGKLSFHVHSNHGGSLFWAHCSGPGFAGDRSRYSLTVTTRSKELAALWVEAVKAGKVRVEERDIPAERTALHCATEPEGKPMKF